VSLVYIWCLLWCCLRLTEQPGGNWGSQSDGGGFPRRQHERKWRNVAQKQSRVAYILWNRPLPTKSLHFQQYNSNNNNNNNKFKYKRLCTETQRMWNLKCTIVPVVIGATGIVTRSLRKNLETIPGKHSKDSLQKTAVLGTSHIIRKVLQCEAWSVSGGDHRWFKRSTGEKRPVTGDMHIV